MSLGEFQVDLQVFHDSCLGACVHLNVNDKLHGKTTVMITFFDGSGLGSCGRGSCCAEVEFLCSPGTHPWSFAGLWMDWDTKGVGQRTTLVLRSVFIEMFAYPFCVKC